MQASRIVIVERRREEYMLTSHVGSECGLRALGEGGEEGAGTGLD